MESNEPREIKVLVADDHPLIRKALKDVLESAPDLKVVGETGNGAEAFELVSQLQPDVVIMDISMPVMNGVEATRRIKARYPLTLVLILTVGTDVNTVFNILEAGASGYLVKSVFGPEVIRTIRTLLDGDLVLDPSISKELVSYLLRHADDQSRPTETERVERISSKGKEVLNLAAQGLSNKEIAIRLGVTEASVKARLVEIFEYLNVRSRTEAVVVGLKSGILNLENLV